MGTNLITETIFFEGRRTYARLPSPGRGIGGALKLGVKNLKWRIGGWGRHLFLFKMFIKKIYKKKKIRNTLIKAI